MSAIWTHSISEDGVLLKMDVDLIEVIEIDVIHYIGLILIVFFKTKRKTKKIK
jgi:hypothetical protein